MQKIIISELLKYCISLNYKDEIDSHESSKSEVEKNT